METRMSRKEDLVLPYFIDNPNLGPNETWEITLKSAYLKRSESY